MYETGGRLREYGGILSAFAETWAGALEVDRESVLSAVSDPVEPFMMIDGRVGTDNPGRATNRIRSDEHDRKGVDRVFVAIRKEQFSDLRAAVS